MAYPYITQAMLEARLGATRVRRLYDDNNDGMADTGAVTRLISDATSKVAGRLQGAFSLAAIAANTPSEVIRLTLDVAYAMAAQRHPEVVPGIDWTEAMKAADRDLDALRKNFAGIGTESTPSPASNEGGVVFPDPDSEVVYSFGRDGFGDF